MRVANACVFFFIFFFSFSPFGETKRRREISGHIQRVENFYFPLVHHCTVKGIYEKKKEREREGRKNVMWCEEKKKRSFGVLFNSCSKRAFKPTALYLSGYFVSSFVMGKKNFFFLFWFVFLPIFFFPFCHASALLFSNIFSILNSYTIILKKNCFRVTFFAS